MRLLIKVEIENSKGHPCAIPFTDYVFSWCHKLPTHTVVMGQNPYRNGIYAEFGSAFSYDESKSTRIPRTVVDMARDLFNSESSEMLEAIQLFQRFLDDDRSRCHIHQRDYFQCHIGENLLTLLP